MTTVDSNSTARELLEQMLAQDDLEPVELILALQTIAREGYEAAEPMSGQWRIIGAHLAAIKELFDTFPRG